MSDISPPHNPRKVTQSREPSRLRSELRHSWHQKLQHDRRSATPPVDGVTVSRASTVPIRLKRGTFHA